MFNLAMNFIAVIVFALANGVTPDAPLDRADPDRRSASSSSATGIGMLLSALYVRFRDVQPIWDVSLQAWFYASPIMYTAAPRLGRALSSAPRASSTPRSSTRSPRC